MKRLVTLAIMVAFILGGFGVAQAVEFKAKGDWQIGVMGVSNPTFDSDDKVDEFQGTTRVRTTFEFIANENLRGVMRVHSGDRTWGAEGIGREDDTFEYDQAYLDFMIPNSPVNMKVGKQPIAFPGTFGSHIFDDTMWGVTATTPITDEVGMTMGWARQDDRVSDGSDKNDEQDFFYAMVPVTLDGVDITPFGVYGMQGSSATIDTTAGMDAMEAGESSEVWWTGVNFAVDMFDPIVISGDFNYGSQRSFDIYGEDASYETDGWIAALSAQYVMDYMTPEIFFMYESGHDESDLRDGEGGVMPSIAGDLYGMSTFAGSGSLLRGIGRAAFDNYGAYGFSAFGATGKMAVGAKLGDISFIDDVTHDLQLTYYQGTNDKDLRGVGDSNDEAFFTTRDTAWEVTFDTQYQMYENLSALLELGYLHPSMSSGHADGVEDDASWKAATGLRYMF